MKGYRTILLNVAMALLGITDYLLDGSVIGSVMSDPKKAGLLVLGVNVVNIVLRSITTGPVGQKK